MILFDEESSGWCTYILSMICPSVYPTGYKWQKFKNKKKHEFLICYLRWRSDSFFVSSGWCASIIWIICPSGYKWQKCINTKTWFSRLLFKIELWFFFVDTCQVDAYLLHEQYVCQATYWCRHPCLFDIYLQLNNKLTLLYDLNSRRPCRITYVFVFVFIKHFHIVSY